MRILIADDDPIIRLDLRQMLENLGYEVVGEAGEGREAVQIAEAEKPDLCILDVKMPVMDGIEAVKILTDAKIAPSILLTAYSDRELVERAKEAGVFAYLVKPFKPSDLPPAIEIARSRYEQHLAISGELSSLTDRFEARKSVDKAKGILMTEHGVNEAEAYRRIQQQSMNARLSMKEVADAIILAKTV